MRDMCCMDCMWCAVVELKNGDYGNICANNVDGHWASEVDLLDSACDGFASNIEEEEG